MSNIDALFTDVDDFNLKFYPVWEKQQLESGVKKRRRAGNMSPSEIMTILIHFHQSNHRDFKNYYLGYVHQNLRAEFPQLLSYTRFMGVVQNILVPLCAYFDFCKGTPTGLSFVDSTSLKVCHQIRIPRHRVFDQIAQRGKSSMGWFYGFKLHLVINHHGEILSAKITTANIDDRAPLPDMLEGIWGKIYADKGYVSKELREKLKEKGIDLLTNVRRNMKKIPMELWDKVMLRKRFIIETVNDQLKSISQIEHTRHRSVHGLMLNILGGLIAYCHKKDKPSINLTEHENTLLIAY